MDGSHIGEIGILDRPQLLFQGVGVGEGRSVAPVAGKASIGDEEIETVDVLAGLVVKGGDAGLGGDIRLDGDHSAKCVGVDFGSGSLNDFEAASADDDLMSAGSCGCSLCLR